MKHVGLVLTSSLVLALGVIAPIALGSHRSHSKGTTVTVEIKSLTKTLLKPTAVHGEKGSITKGGTPSGTCSGQSGAGALDAATHGNWTGKYYSSLKDIFVQSILGVKPTGKDYWGIYVNGKTSQTGICHIKLTAGEKLLFKIIK